MPELCISLVVSVGSLSLGPTAWISPKLCWLMIGITLSSIWSNGTYFDLKNGFSSVFVVW